MPHEDPPDVRPLTPDGAAELLRGHQLRATQQRVAVLIALSHPDSGHLRVDEVREAVTRSIGSVSVQAVYDVLAQLLDSGLVNRIEPTGSPAMFEIRAGDNHHHLVCRGCGAVADVDCSTGPAPCLSPSDASGFVVDQAEVTYWGLCPNCQKTT